MSTVNIGLNGFGRIGRAFTRIALQKNALNITAINTGKTAPDMLSYLLKYDSVYRTFDHEVLAEDHGIRIDDKKIASSNIRDPKDIPWDKHGVDVVIDCTGVFKTRDELSKHLRGSVKKVVLTAPPKDDSISYVVLGVNDDTIDFAKEDIISNCSCTTNCAAPMFKVLNDRLTVQSGFLTTAHAYTSSQPILDSSARTHTRARAAGLSIVPTTTGAARAVVKVIPQLKGKIDAIALRVPVPVGSFSDVTTVVEKKTKADEINRLFKEASKTSLKGILAYEDIPLVSSDYIGSPFSCVFDANYTQVINDHFVKVFGWYDNEWGYSCRLVELVVKLSKYL